MTVYIVLVLFGGTCSPIGAFSSMERAQEYIETNIHDDTSCCVIDTELDVGKSLKNAVEFTFSDDCRQVVGVKECFATCEIPAVNYRKRKATIDINSNAYTQYKKGNPNLLLRAARIKFKETA